MKASRIMVCPTVHLPSALSDADRDVLRRVLLDNVRGIDAIHDKRWRRAIGCLINSEPGEVTEFWNMRTRSLPFHKRWMSIERRFFENQDGYQTLRGFRRWLKTGAGLGDYERVGKRLVFVPASVSFDEASDDEFREFVKAAEDFLRTDRAARTLWPHLKPAKRAEMVETLLANPNQHEGAPA
jgi:hypothetical protein